MNFALRSSLVFRWEDTGVYDYGPMPKLPLNEENNDKLYTLKSSYSSFHRKSVYASVCIPFKALHASPAANQLRVSSSFFDLSIANAWIPMLHTWGSGTSLT